MIKASKGKQVLKCVGKNINVQTFICKSIIMSVETNPSKTLLTDIEVMVQDGHLVHAAGLALRGSSAEMWLREQQRLWLLCEISAFKSANPVSVAVCPTSK